MVIVKIIGGFGNQLFQYAAGRALSLHLKTELKLDFSFFDTEEKKKVLRLNVFNLPYTVAEKNDYRNIKNLEKPLFVKRILNKIGIRIPPFYKSSHIFEENILTIFDKKQQNNQNFYIEGWLGDEQCFINIRDLLLKELNINTILDEENNKIKSQIDATNSIAIHVRRGDYLKNAYFKTLPIEYYIKAINEIIQKIRNPHFFFFSDDIDWVKNNFLHIENSNFIENNNKKDTQWSTKGDVEDLMLIKSCKHQIIANSTYSWWGAWLNNNSDKLVYYPEQWFENTTAQTNFESNKFIPKNWNKIKF